MDPRADLRGEARGSPSRNFVTPRPPLRRAGRNTCLQVERVSICHVEVRIASASASIGIVGDPLRWYGSEVAHSKRLYAKRHVRPHCHLLALQIRCDGVSHRGVFGLVAEASRPSRNRPNPAYRPHSPPVGGRRQRGVLRSGFLVVMTVKGESSRASKATRFSR